MKKFLLLILLVVSFAFSACAKEDAVTVDGGANQGEGGWFSSLGSSLASYNAEKNLERELSERVETSPFHAFNLLADNLKNGAVNMNFSYKDWWTNWQDELRTSTTGANITLQSDWANLNFALTGDITDDGETHDFAAFLNRERAAVGSSLIGGDNYGVDFTTLVADVVRIVNELNIAGGEDVMTVFNQITDWLGNSSAPEWQAYIDAFEEFLLNSESIGTAELNGVTVTRVTYNMVDYFDFYSKWLNIFENDPFVISVFENPLFSDTLGISLADAMRELRNAIDMAGDEFNSISNYSLVYYIDENDRLLRMVIDFTMEQYGEEVQANMVFCFGNSATDVWRFDVNMKMYGMDIYAKVVWDIFEKDGHHIHQFDMSASDGGWINVSIILGIDWNPATGRFAITRGLRADELFSGNFIVNSDNTFKLSLDFSNDDNDEDWGNELSFELSTSRGVNIGNVDFINVLSMGVEELMGLTQLFPGFGMSAGNSWDWDEDWDYGWDNDWDWGLPGLPGLGNQFFIESQDDWFSEGLVRWFIEVDALDDEEIWCDVNGWLSQEDWIALSDAGAF
jgi:hypothetical protein